jgi:hypothetical protein
VRILQNQGLKTMQSLEEVFKVIHDYHQLSFSDCLRIILADRAMSISILHQRLLLRNYYLSLESLYRYFNPNLNSSRFPSREFMLIFSDILQLTEEQGKLLLDFWDFSKFARKSYSSGVNEDL